MMMLGLSISLKLHLLVMLESSFTIVTCLEYKPRNGKILGKNLHKIKNKIDMSLIDQKCVFLDLQDFKNLAQFSINAIFLKDRTTSSKLVEYILEI
jgi:hypothetical protein